MCRGYGLREKWPRSPEWLRKAVRGGNRWIDSMTVTLEKLEALSRD